MYFEEEKNLHKEVLQRKKILCKKQGVCQRIENHKQEYWQNQKRPLKAKKYFNNENYNQESMGSKGVFLDVKQYHFPHHY